MCHFRTNFLDNVEFTLSKKPSGEALLELLRLATPDLKGSEVAQGSALRTLQARVRHIQDPERATRLCQDVEVFHNNCPKVPKKLPCPSKRQRSQSPTVLKKTTRSHSSLSSLPLEFDAKKDKWSHIEYRQPSHQRELSDEQIATFVAYQCINTRGAIAHGKQIGLYYTSESLSKISRGVKRTFDKTGGCKKLEGIEAIKTEIVSNGPVVCVSFRFDEALRGSGNFPQLAALQNKEVFLVSGWKLVEFGEAWLVQPLARPNQAVAATIPVAMGKFGIEDLCLAPIDHFENDAWEKGPYLDLDLTHTPEWRTWTGIERSLSTAQYLTFSKQIGKLSFSPTYTSSRNQFVTIREKSKIAQSKRGTLNWIEWKEGDQKWSFSVSY